MLNVIREMIFKIFFFLVKFRKIILIEKVKMNVNFDQLYYYTLYSALLHYDWNEMFITLIAIHHVKNSYKRLVGSSKTKVKNKYKKKMCERKTLNFHQRHLKRKNIFAKKKNLFRRLVKKFLRKFTCILRN